jgi:hypothetical protein
VDIYGRLSDNLLVHPPEVVGIGPLRPRVLDRAADPCADKIDIRRLIWAAVKNKADFFADGRMYAT